MPLALRFLAAAAGLMSTTVVAAEPLFDETASTTLFAFDRVSIPFTENLRLTLRPPVKHPGNPVVRRGGRGAPDSWAVQFYGSIIREGATYRMWYVASGDEERRDPATPRSAPWRVAYAESTDGLTWSKPSLGLVAYRGTKDNNLVALDADPLGILNVKVLHEPDAPPAERYKMTAHVWFNKEPKGPRFGTLALFMSPDGLTWKSVNGARPVQAELPRGDMVLPWTHYEPAGGLYKWDGLYYTSGQNAFGAPQPYHGRVVRSFVSGDFRRWEPASAVGFVRTPQHTLLGPGRSRDGEQTHEGVSVWHRGNVLLGVSGIWHGHAEWSGVTIDLGFVLSNDGVNFREPAHEWVFIPRGKDGDWDEGGVLQAQGFENIGEETYIYYGAWDPRKGGAPRGGVGVVTLPRDRFGDLAIDRASIGKGDYQVPDLTGSFVTAAIPVRGTRGQRFHINAAGLGPKAGLKVELLDRHLQPLPGYSGADAATVGQSGFQTPVVWRSGAVATALPAEVRMRVTYVGDERASIRFSALYARAAQ